MSDVPGNAPAAAPQQQAAPQQAAPQQQAAPSAPSVEANQALTALRGMGNRLSQETSQGINELQNKGSEPAAQQPAAQEPGQQQPAPAAQQPDPGQQQPGQQQAAPQAPAAPQEPGQQQAAPDASASPTGEEPGNGPTGGPQTGQPGQPQEEFYVDNPLYGGKKQVGPANEPGQELKFETIDDFFNHMKESHGIENYNGLSEKIANWQQAEQSHAEVSAQYKGVQDLFSSMPPELYDSIISFTKGEDWKSRIETSAIDFTKEANAYSDRQLVDAMMPGKLTEEDWTEFADNEGDPTVKRLVQSTIDASTNAFNNKGAQVKEAANSRVLKARENQQKYDQSAVKAREHFGSQFADADAAFVSSIENKFKGNGLAALFYNEDGTLREDAYVRAAMAEQGVGLIDQYKSIAERRVKTEAIQEVLSVGAQEPQVSQGTGAAPQADDIRPEVKDTIAWIKGMVPQQSF
jgi:hypothetical protein